MRSQRLLLLLFLAADAYLAAAVLSWRDQMLSQPQGTVRSRRHTPAMRDPEPPETTASIPREQAEAPAPPPAEHRRFHRVVVADGASLRIGDATIRLHGISAPERGRTCRRASGETWPCGNRAAAALSSVIRSRAVDCDVTSRPGLDPVGRCRVGNVDLSEWMLRQGWAEPREDDAGHADGSAATKAQGLGLRAGGPAR